MKDQMMTLAGYFTLEWSDARLDWSTNPTYNSDVPVIYTSQDYVWIPSLVVSNSVDDLAVISDNTVVIRVTNDGTLNWTPGGVYQTQCSTDVTYYPFDTQVCSVILSTWGYTSIEITLNSTGVDLSYYEPDGEWEFISNSVTTTTRTSGQNSMPQVSFEMTFKRRPVYQVMNTILPMMLLGLLICFVFHLRPDSGGKIGYSLTTLLAFAVYLTIVSADMPTTSLHTAYLSVYLVIMLFLGVSAVLLSLFIINCHHTKEDKPIPNYIENLCSALKKITCSNCCKKNVVNDMEKSEKLETERTAIEAFQPELSWSEVATILDRFFFKLYLIIFFGLTIIVLLILVIHYYIV